jgi:4'-phosphopantetheinyl transferase
MPLIREWESDPYSLAAIWKIEEPEQFFADATGIFSDIKNDKRRIERLAGRFLLKYLKADFPLHDILKDEHDKPRIPDNAYFFSISHSYPYVAAVISPYTEAGIDIQAYHPRMLQLQHKFLSEEEQLFTANDPKLITLAWCAKEAAYKWQGKRGVEFIDHLPIEYFSEKGKNFQITINLKLIVPNLAILLEGSVNESFACCAVHNISTFSGGTII